MPLTAIVSTISNAVPSAVSPTMKQAKVPAANWIVPISAAIARDGAIGFRAPSCCSSGVTKARGAVIATRSSKGGQRGDARAAAQFEQGREDRCRRINGRMPRMNDRLWGEAMQRDEARVARRPVRPTAFMAKIRL